MPIYLTSIDIYSLIFWTFYKVLYIQTCPLNVTVDNNSDIGICRQLSVIIKQH